MAGEVLLINPRHRRRRRRKARGTHRRRRRRLSARRNPANPRRHRRRVYGRRRRHARRRHRVHRNPQLFAGVNLVGIGIASVGYVGTRYATGWALSMLPPEWSKDPNTANLVRIGVKAGIGVGLPILLRRWIGRGTSNWLAIGGGIAVLTDIFQTYLAGAIPIPLADYEPGMLTDYEPGMLTGQGDFLTGEEEFGVGDAYGQSVYGG